MAGRSSPRRFLVTVALATIAFSSALSVIVPTAHAGGLAQMVTSIGEFAPAGSIVAGDGGVYIEGAGFDFGAVAGGVLYHWDATDGLTFVTGPPASCGFECDGEGYLGMAARITSTGLRVALIGHGGGEIGGVPGLYYCDGVTPVGVTSCSSFIPVNGFPTGLAFDRNLNLFYVDPFADDEVELTAASGYTVATVYHNFPAGNMPGSIFIDPFTDVHYVADTSCSGNIFATTAATPGVYHLAGSVGSTITAITLSLSNPSHARHIYVAVGGGGSACPTPVAQVLDFTDGTILPSTTDGTSGASYISGLSTNLYFAQGNFAPGNIFRTYDIH